MLCCSGITHPLSFRLKLSLPQHEEVTLCSNNLLPHCEIVIWNYVFVAMDSIVLDLSTWRRCFSSKKCFVAYEFIAGFTPIGYVCSANGMWIEACDLQRSSTRVYGCSVLVVKTVTLQKEISVNNINWTLKSPISFGLNCLLLCSVLRVGLEWDHWFPHLRKPCHSIHSSIMFFLSMHINLFSCCFCKRCNIQTLLFKYSILSCLWNETVDQKKKRGFCAAYICWVFGFNWFDCICYSDNKLWTPPHPHDWLLK